LAVAAVDVDQQPELAARFEVRFVPMLVLTQNGRVAGRIVGRATRPQIEALLAEHFEREPSPGSPAAHIGVRLP
jgi:thioredoxin-like negative regulator of GroEL